MDTSKEHIEILSDNQTSAGIQITSDSFSYFLRTRFVTGAGFLISKNRV